MIKLKFPVDNYQAISQFFGENPAFYKKLTGVAGHQGIDWAVPEGSNVYAVADGEIFQVDNPVFGKRISQTFTFGGGAVYGHLSEQLVRVGDRVTAGQLIAKSGNTGYPKYSSGAHLHVGIWINGDKDPKMGDYTDALGYFLEGEDIEELPRYGGKAYRIENGRKRWFPDTPTSVAHGVDKPQLFDFTPVRFSDRWMEVPTKLRDGEWMQYKDGKHYEFMKLMEKKGLTKYKGH